MKILFIAPLPPPLQGHSLAAKVFLDGLIGDHEVAVVDLNVKSHGDGSISLGRLIEVAKVLIGVWRKRRGADVIYLTISESLAGNLKDLLIYCLCVGKLSRMYIHLHGGSIKMLLFDRYPLLRKLNARFIRRFAGIIISGRSHLPIFAGMIDSRRVHIAENFALDNLFVPEAAIVAKFADTAPLRILYVSNMIRMKGFDDLAEAYLSLPQQLQEKIRVDLAGRFDSPTERAQFLNKIAGTAGIRYHGVVDEAQKEFLFSQAHVFCLPTAFLEGQPISILEAYASGCVVLTTGQEGIRDVFTHSVNGFEVRAKSAPSIVAALEALSADPGALLQIAVTNRKLAGNRYRTSSYQSLLRKIIEAPLQLQTGQALGDGGG